MKRRTFLQLSIAAIAAAHVLPRMRSNIIAHDVGWFRIPMHVQPSPMMTPTITLTHTVTPSMTPSATPIIKDHHVFMPEVHK